MIQVYQHYRTIMRFCTELKIIGDRIVYRKLEKLKKKIVPVRLNQRHHETRKLLIHTTLLINK